VIENTSLSRALQCFSIPPDLYAGHCASIIRKVAIIALPVSLLVSPLNTAFAQSLDNANPSSTDFSRLTEGDPARPVSTTREQTKLGSRLNLLKDRVQNGGELPSRARVSAGHVVIDAIATDSGPALLRDLSDLGLQNGAVFGKLVSGNFPLSALSAAESLATLQLMRLSSQFKRAGSVSNQADAAMKSDIAKLNLGLDGSGITIGILSDSYNQLGGAAADIASGDLPTTVNVLDDTSPGANSDEGRAMAQLIHDIAPGADLVFHTAFLGAAGFAQGILDLRAAGADVIVDDVGNALEPFLQDGVIAQAVDQVVADGAVYFSAAGNAFNNSYESAYVDSGATTSALGVTGTPYELGRIHLFTAPDNAGQFFDMQAGDTMALSLQWDQPFASAGGTGSASDLDVFLYDGTTGAFITSSDDFNVGADAVEFLVYENTTGALQSVLIVVGIYEPAAASQPTPGQLKWVNYGSPLNHSPLNLSSTIVGHPNAEGAIAVGAAYYLQTPVFGINPPLLESFSSHGGTEILFDTAGALLGSPVDRLKPELVAPDGTDTTFFGTDDFDVSGHPDFFGTSAAAPHAAAVAALQLECNPALSPAQIQSNQLAFAIDMDASGFDYLSGDGLIDAEGTLSIDLCPDIYEPDDSFATPSMIVEGVPQTNHNINNGGADVDYATFALTCDADVVIETSGASGDTVLELFDSAMNSIAFNDDSTLGGLFSRITTTLLSGDYFISVNEFGSNDNLPDYTLSYDRTCLMTGPTCNGLPVTVDLNLGQTTGPNDDVVLGTPGPDDIRGKGGNDTICGMGGNDFIHGNSGDDWIHGGEGVDNLRGGRGNDTIYTGTGATVGTSSRAFGGYDVDTIFGDVDADDLRGGKGNDFIYGGDGDDEITGNDDDDILEGEGGNDSIKGGNGENDELYGGADDDTLNGGGGANDLCDGGGQAGDTSTNCEI